MSKVIQPIRQFICRNKDHHTDSHFRIFENEKCDNLQLPIKCDLCNEDMKEVNICKIDENGNICISEWSTNGYMMYQRESLDIEEKESFFQCLIRLGLDPYQYSDQFNIPPRSKFNHCPFCHQSMPKLDQLTPEDYGW